jgi:hypothetical protein
MQTSTGALSGGPRACRLGVNFGKEVGQSEDEDAESVGLRVDVVPGDHACDLAWKDIAFAFFIEFLISANRQSACEGLQPLNVRSIVRIFDATYGCQCCGHVARDAAGVLPVGNPDELRVETASFLWLLTIPSVAPRATRRRRSRATRLLYGKRWTDEDGHIGKLLLPLDLFDCRNLAATRFILQ